MNLFQFFTVKNEVRLTASCSLLFSEQTGNFPGTSGTVVARRYLGGVFLIGPPRVSGWVCLSWTHSFLLVPALDITFSYFLQILAIHPQLPASPRVTCWLCWTVRPASAPGRFASEGTVWLQEDDEACWMNSWGSAVSERTAGRLFCHEQRVASSTKRSASWWSISHGRTPSTCTQEFL